MKISRSTFYYRAKEKPFEELKAEIDLEDEIEKICLNWPRYGYRRVSKQLHREGWSANHKRVLRMMRERLVTTPSWYSSGSLVKVLF